MLKYSMINKKLPVTQKPVIAQVELAQYEENAKKAMELLESPEFEFFRKFLETEKKSIEGDFVHNRILKIVEHRRQTNGNEIEVAHTKREQMDELAGQYKLIEEIYGFLHNIINIPKEAYSAEEKGRVTIEAKKK
ncbi:MAG: hypothetical protein AUJ72_05770 [Candidatus Omnitrophica bacterium CG1_02_46_14]|nr:MAG: hypothetical protein AUJ72_05770 [Candidatus Omnitrophica bacterium CG1_02_46_14]